MNFFLKERMCPLPYDFLPRLPWRKASPHNWLQHTTGLFFPHLTFELFIPVRSIQGHSISLEYLLVKNHTLLWIFRINSPLTSLSSSNCFILLSFPLILLLYFPFRLFLNLNKYIRETLSLENQIFLIPTDGIFSFSVVVMLVWLFNF